MKPVKITYTIRETSLLDDAPGYWPSQAATVAELFAAAIRPRLAKLYPEAEIEVDWFSDSNLRSVPWGLMVEAESQLDAAKVMDGVRQAISEVWVDDSWWPEPMSKAATADVEPDVEPGVYVFTNGSDAPLRVK